jgi:hypothetical protein
VWAVDVDFYRHPGRLTEFSAEQTAMVDTVADACAADDGRRIAELYGVLAVPEDMVS